jgi:hypothetical protein
MKKGKIYSTILVLPKELQDLFTKIYNYFELFQAESGRDDGRGWRVPI